MSSKPVSNETLLQQLQWRYAVKKFDPARKISAEDWQTLERALVLTPSSFGLQPWKFFVVTSPEVKASKAAASARYKRIRAKAHRNAARAKAHARALRAGEQTG